MGSLSVSGIWPPQWRDYAINWLEMEAIRLALLHFSSQVHGKHVLVMSDNKKAIAFVNKMGGVCSRHLYFMA